MVLELYEHLVEARTVLPTFYRDFPVEVSPLTRAHREDPRLAEKWDLVAFGTEIGTGYSELVDPVEQRARLTAQSLLAAGGDAEAMQIDEDFLRALEYGMPPAGGMGMGIDRVLIMLTGASIRETILFPIVRSRLGDPDGAVVGIPHHRVDAHRDAERGRVQHEAVADVDADVADVREEEHEVARLQLSAATRARRSSTGRR